jgi:hypothetical protein
MRQRSRSLPRGQTPARAGRRLAIALCAAAASETDVTWAIGLGGDTDTNAAVTGALVGARDGVSAIPERWLEVLRQRQRIERAAERLAARREPTGETSHRRGEHGLATRV